MPSTCAWSTRLPSGLEYVGNPTVTGTGNSIGAPLITGDGSAGNPYVLSWSTAAGNADINVAKGASVQVSYDVRVQNGVAALTNLANSVVVEWTGIDGNSTYERNGAGCPTVTAPNDYCAGPATLLGAHRSAQAQLHQDRGQPEACASGRRGAVPPAADQSQ